MRPEGRINKPPCLCRGGKGRGASQLKSSAARAVQNISVSSP